MDDYDIANVKKKKNSRVNVSSGKKQKNNMKMDEEELGISTPKFNTQLADEA